MAQPLLKRISTIAVATESTVGTAETLSAGDGAINAYDVSINANIEVQEREGQGSFNRLTGSPGARSATCSFKVDMAWDGLAHPLWATVLLPACGVTASGDVYTPKSEALEAAGATIKSCTIGVYENGLLKTMAGCVGNCKITATAGMMATLEFEFQGLWQPVVDSAIIAPTYPTDLPSRFAAQNFTWQSVSQCVESVEFDFGNEVIMRECVRAADYSGFYSALIVDRYPKVTCNPEARLVADDDYYGDWLDATEGALSFGFDGPAGASSNGSIVVSAPKAQLLNVQEGDRNKLLINDLEFGLNKNGATKDTEFSITFTDKV
jgi:hypothetical protein